MNDQNLIWIDLEMTGLDTINDNIMEIATIVTDLALNVLEEGPVFAIHQSDEVLSSMGAWVTNQHAKSGLTERCRASKTTLQEAEAATIAFLEKYVPAGRSPMCGNSICQDRRFLARQMPRLERYFHYRHIDVSTLKELTGRWAPEVAKGFSKVSKHLALDDIKDSIEELQYYREQCLKI